MARVIVHCIGHEMSGASFMALALQVFAPMAEALSKRTKDWEKGGPGAGCGLRAIHDVRGGNGIQEAKHASQWLPIQAKVVAEADMSMELPHCFVASSPSFCFCS